MSGALAEKNRIAGGDLNDWRLALYGGVFLHMSGNSVGKNQKLGAVRTHDQVIHTWLFSGKWVSGDKTYQEE